MAKLLYGEKLVSEMGQRKLVYKRNSGYKGVMERVETGREMTSDEM